MGRTVCVFRLLADGYVYGGTPDVKKTKHSVFRWQWFSGKNMTVRVSIFGKDTVHLKGENIDKRIPREDFATVAELIYAAIRQSREDDVTSPDGVEEFLDEVAILIWKLRRTTARISAWLFTR